MPWFLDQIVIKGRCEKGSSMKRTTYHAHYMEV